LFCRISKEHDGTVADNPILHGKFYTVKVVLLTVINDYCIQLFIYGVIGLKIVSL